MTHNLRALAGLGLALVLAGACSPAPDTISSTPLVVDTFVPEHPGLLVRAADLPALRARAATRPWQDVARAALRYARTTSFDPNLDEFTAKTRMTDLCGALALAYVLDPRPLWVDKLRETLAHWPAFHLAKGDGTRVRWRQSAMTQSILALDVMHGALDPLVRAELEALLGDIVLEWWANLEQDGTPSTPAVVALWALYTGQRGLARRALELYSKRSLDGLTPAGVYDSGPGYAWVRQGGDRLSKYVLDDVLVATGWAPELYSEPQLATLHAWMYRGSCTPWRTNLTFGDTDPTRPIEALLGYVQPYRVHRFAPEAAGNAAWIVRDVEPRPLLSTYVVLDASLLAPEPPTSALWQDTACLREPGGSEQALLGALWSARTSGSHSHHDVNAVHLCAYGENVLRNSGYCGSGIGVDAVFDWDWIRSTAESSNTVTVGGAEHESRSGGGLVEGLLAPGLDHAVGTAGPALENATHARSLLLVHGEPGHPGYFVLLDELVTDEPGALVHVNLHPDSAAATTEVPFQEYEWRVNQRGTDDVRVTLFLATPPSGVELLDGGLCAFDDREYVGTYLRAAHRSDARGRANLLTLVVPHDANHPQPELTRLPGGAAFSGALVRYPDGATDVLVAPREPSLPVTIGQALFTGAALHTRLTPGGRGHYFARRGRTLDDGAPSRTGFDSDTPLTLHVRGREVRVTSATGATITFHEPSLDGALWSSPAGTATRAGRGFVQVSLRPGTFAFDLESGSPLP